MDKYVTRGGPGSGQTKKRRTDYEENVKTGQADVSVIPPIVSTTSTSIEKPDIESPSTSSSSSFPCNKQNQEQKGVTPSKLQPPSFNRWKNVYPWLTLNSDGKAVCSICIEATQKKCPLRTSRNSDISRSAFISNGFNTWKNATISFNNHQNSDLHRTAAKAINDLQEKSIYQRMSNAHQKEMMDSRIALCKIFSTINTLARQGLALRGDGSDEKSNLMQILRMRAEDVPLLKSWLNRPGKRTWTHHDIVNEIVEMMAAEITRKHLQVITSAQYYALILDETSDISRLEQVSISLRIVTDELEVQEIFMGFYETADTTAETLFKIVNDVLLRFGLDIINMRGQCYDGASNVKGRVKGLQARVKAVEPRALHVHCSAHSLNLVVQDAIEDLWYARNFIGTVKELINFIRDSPKRLAQFKNLQSSSTGKSKVLSPFCPTRWCVRIKSLKTIHVHENYLAAMHFFDDIQKKRQVDSASTAKASGFLNKMEEFEFYFLLTLMIKVFERIEILNAELQRADLSLNESHAKVTAVAISISEMKNTRFEDLWNEAVKGATDLGSEQPKLPRPRKVPGRYSSNSSMSVKNFDTIEEYYKDKFIEVTDHVLASLSDRFQCETMDRLNDCENFAIGKTKDVAKICSYFHDDFNKEKLLLHQEMFIDIVRSQKMNITCLKEVVDYLKTNLATAAIVSEFSKFVRILLTIPASSCTAERSFSALRRLKNYMRSSMTQKRLNHLAIMHIHEEDSRSLDMNHIINAFISKNTVRKTTFAL